MSRLHLCERRSRLLVYYVPKTTRKTKRERWIVMIYLTKDLNEHGKLVDHKQIVIIKLSKKFRFDVGGLASVNNRFLR